MDSLLETYSDMLEKQKSLRVNDSNVDFPDAYDNMFRLEKVQDEIGINITNEKSKALRLRRVQRHQGERKFGQCCYCESRVKVVNECPPFPYVDLLALEGLSCSELRLVSCEHGHLFLEQYVTTTFPFSKKAFENRGRVCLRCDSTDLVISLDNNKKWKRFDRKHKSENGLYRCLRCLQEFTIDDDGVVVQPTVTDAEFLDFVNSCKVWAVEKELLYRTLSEVHKMAVSAFGGFLKSARKRVRNELTLKPRKETILKCLAKYFFKTDDFIKDYIHELIPEIYDELLSGIKGVSCRDWRDYFHKEEYDKFVIKEANRYLATKGKLYHSLLTPNPAIGKKEDDEVRHGLFEMLSMPLVHINEFRNICKDIKASDRIHECDVIERRYVIDGYTFALLHWFSNKRIILPRPSKKHSQAEYDRINDLANKIPDNFEKLYLEDFGIDVKKAFLSLYSEDDYQRLKKNVGVFKAEKLLACLEVLVFDKYHNVILRKRFYDHPHITFLGPRRSNPVEISIRKLVKRWTSEVKIRYNAWDSATAFFRDLVEGKFRDKYPNLPNLEGKNADACYRKTCPRDLAFCMEDAKRAGGCKDKTFCKDLHFRRFYYRLKEKVVTVEAC